jgi:hypothetical protein
MIMIKRLICLKNIKNIKNITSITSIKNIRIPQRFLYSDTNYTEPIDSHYLIGPKKVSSIQTNTCCGNNCQQELKLTIDEFNKIKFMAFLPNKNTNCKKLEYSNRLIKERMLNSNILKFVHIKNTFFEIHALPNDKICMQLTQNNVYEALSKIY